jgi:hypothetical protein
MKIKDRIQDLGPFNILSFAGLSLPRLGGAASGQHWLPGLEFLTDLGHRVQHRLGDLLQDVELADLVLGLGEQVLDDRRIQRRAIRGDPPNLQAASVQLRLELPEERPDVVLRGVVFQNPIEEPLEGAVIDDAEHAEGPVVQFIGGEVPAEGFQGLVEILPFDAALAFFPPPPRPSSG